MRKLTTPLVTLLLLVLLTPALYAEGAGTVEQIEVQGLFRMTREAFLHGFGVKVGDRYDEADLRRRFKRLWKLGLFEDIKVESEAGKQGGMVLVVKVQERPVLTAVTYQETKYVTRTEIEDMLTENDIRLELSKPLDPQRVFFAESAIRELLGSKGFLDATVEAEIRSVTDTTKAVHFFIAAGGKTRILKIDFVGNEQFSDRKLKGQLRLTQERRWYWPWSSKNLYHPGKWDQDVASVRDLYQNFGYLDVDLRPPVVEVRKEKGKSKKKEGKNGKNKKAEKQQSDKIDSEAGQGAGEVSEPDHELTPKQREKQAKKRRRQEEKARKQADKEQKIKRWVYLQVPVNEGSSYTLGDVKITGNDKFPEATLRQFIPLQEGAVVQNDKLERGVEGITRLYEDLGHIYTNVVRRIQRREEGDIADIEIAVEEDEPYYMGRIEFAGNVATHDRVLRREMLISEGDLFSRTKLDYSKIKVNQLGYFQVPAEPVIEPVEGENRVKVTLAGEEQGRNEIQIGGGYSGLDGAFFNGVYSTRNFLGRGQVLSTAIQVGGRSTRYQISFQEPWFLNRPLRFGFSVFRRDLDFGSSLSSTSTGGGLLLGKRLGRFSNLNLGYNFEAVESRTVLTSVDGAATDVTSITADNRVSSVTPVFSYNTINNPYRPTAGKSFSLSFQVAGGPLGGDTSFLKPIASFIGYHRALRKSYLAFHGQMGLIREFKGGSDVVTNSEIEGVPRFQRFWLGGDILGPRVFETRSITPLRFVTLEDGRIVDVLGDPRYMSPDDFVTSNGIPVLLEVGGDRFFLFQSELVFPLNEQAELALFVDVGDSLFEDQSLDFETTRVSAGIELRFHLPIFPVPLRLIYGVPVRELEGDRTGNFTFSIGKSF